MAAVAAPSDQPKSTMMGHPGMLEELQQELADKQRSDPSFDDARTVESNSPLEARLAYSANSPPIGSAPVLPQAQQPIAPQQQQFAQQPPQQQFAQQPIAPTQQQSPPPQQHPVFQQGLGQPSPRGSSPLVGNFGMQDARFGDDAQQAVPAAVVPYRDSLTEKVAPLPAPEAKGGNDWDESLITILLVFGVLLIACFVAPWSIGSGKTPTVFAWSIFSTKDAPLGALIVTSMIALTGLGAIAVGSLRLSTTSRALLGFVIGLVPITAAVAFADTIAWRSIVSYIGTIFVVGALLLRTRYIETIVPRAIAGVAAIMLLALYFIPIGGQIPAMGLLDAISSNPGATKVLPIIGDSVGPLTLGILPFTVILLSFLVWLPGSNRGVLTTIAMVLLFAPFVAGLCQPLLGDNLVASLKSGLASYLFLPLAGTAWVAMASYGLRGLLDQKLS